MSENIEKLARHMAELEGWRWDDSKHMLDIAGWGWQQTNRERETWRRRAKVAIEMAWHDHFRSLARHYMRALEKVIVESDLDAAHGIAGQALGSNPAVNSAASKAFADRLLTNEQKELVLLFVIGCMGGQTDSGESKWSWLNYFCLDEVHNVHSDTFNRCHENGWLWTTHNTDTDASVTEMTKAGRAMFNSVLAPKLREAFAP